MSRTLFIAISQNIALFVIALPGGVEVKIHNTHCPSRAVVGLNGVVN